MRCDTHPSIVHVARLIKGDDDTYTFDDPKTLPGTVSLSLDAEDDTNPFYADGIVYCRSVDKNGYSVDLELALIPDRFREDILQEIRDTNVVLIETANTTDTVYFALLFEFDGDQHKIRYCLYHCQASRPEISSQTKEDAIGPVTETLPPTADLREDGLVNAQRGGCDRHGLPGMVYKGL